MQSPLSPFDSLSRTEDPAAQHDDTAHEGAEDGAATPTPAASAEGDGA